MRDLTIKEVAERLEVADQVVRRWCRQGKLPNAYQLPIKTGNGQVWMIPAADLESFQKPDKGRPVSPDPSPEALRKRRQRAKVK